MRGYYLVRALAGSYWAIQPDKLAAICQVVERHAGTFTLGATEMQEATEAAARSPVRRRNGAVAVIPVYGTIAQRVGLLERASGGVGTEALATAFRGALDDDEVGSILLDFDSPGGSVYGVDELATEIRDARGRKPIVALANSLMASAAYWIGSQADEVVATPSADVGSIGVYALHADTSEFWKSEGVTWSIVRGGQYKAEGIEYEPLTSEARTHMQGRVDEYYGMFVSAVSRGREIPSATVRSDFGEGRVFGSKAALDAGMIDRIATFDETVARMTAAGSRQAGMSSDARRRRVRRQLAAATP